jgi:hypothetical protein
VIEASTSGEIALTRKSTGRRDKSHDGLLFPPERGQFSTFPKLRKGLFLLLLRNLPQSLHLPLFDVSALGVRDDLLGHQT